MEGYWNKVLTQRLSRRRALAATGTTAAAAAFLAACGGDSGSGGETTDQSSLITKPVDAGSSAKSGGTMKWMLGAEPAHLDFHTGLAPMNLIYNITNSALVNEKAGVMGPPTYDEVIPDLAQSWEWSSDQLQLTLKLRPNVKWHNKAPVNGRVLDSSDVIFSWERFAKQGSDRASLVNSVNPKAPILGFSAPDAQTVVVKLKDPVNYLLSALTPGRSGNYIVVPRETDNGFDIRKDVIGTGPFMLSNWTPSVGMTFKKNPDYYEAGKPYIDTIEAPLILEYAQQLAQFKAGNIYTMVSSNASPPSTNIRAEDVIQLKQDKPDVLIYRGDPFGFNPGNTVGFGWLPAGQSPFRDERVRQALSMSYDRDLFIDVFNNVSAFEAQGLPMETQWHTALGAAPGWRLDPRDSKFGENAKYFKRDIAEAKKLLAAAGHPNGLDVQSTYIGGTQLGADFQRTVEVREEMAREAGFRPTPNLVDYTTEYLPKYRDGNGKFEGWSYRTGVPSAETAVAWLDWRYNSAGGPGFLGFDVNGRGDGSGDPQVDSLIMKARSELDTEKRKALVNDLQKYLAKAMYCVSLPGAASWFQAAWPAIGNYMVSNGDRRSFLFNWWVDDTKAPIKASS